MGLRRVDTRRIDHAIDADAAGELLDCLNRILFLEVHHLVVSARDGEISIIVEFRL